MDIIQPPYKYMEEDKKNILGYLLAKRVSLEIMRYQQLIELFLIKNMKETFQWFDKENQLEFWEKIFDIYRYTKGYEHKDALMYTLTDFFTYYVNYKPAEFSEIMTKHLEESQLSDDSEKRLNEIFLKLGYQYENKIFTSASSHPEVKKEVLSLIDLKLKSISKDLHKTWKSMSEDLISNNEDKATTLSAKSRKLINGLLRELTPKLKFDPGEEDQIKKRLTVIFNNSKSEKTIEKISELITSLNQSQSKGDHEFLDENTAYFTFQITESVIFWILSST